MMIGPLLNQKHAWPLLPTSFLGSLLSAEGKAHQLGVVNGTGFGTSPFQGASVPSMACTSYAIIQRSLQWFLHALDEASAG